MKPFAFHIRTGFQNLVEMAHNRQFRNDFSERGSFTAVEKKGLRYWYHYESIPGLDKKTVKYLGPVGDPLLDKFVEEHRIDHDRYRTQKALASSMRQAGMPAPDFLEGAISKAFEREGYFRKGAFLVGSVAYQTYPGLMGISFGNQHHRTNDLDIAQNRRIEILIEKSDVSKDVEEILKSVDPSFRPEFQANRPHAGPVRYKNREQYAVDLLTGPLRTDRRRDEPKSISFIPGAQFQPLRVMDYLLEYPVRSVLLHEAGIGVTVPHPARYALHKIIVSQQRGMSQDPGKSEKDLRQAETILNGLFLTRGESQIVDSWADLFENYKKERNFLIRGFQRLEKKLMEKIGEELIKQSVAPFEGSQSTEDGLKKITSLLNPTKKTATER